MDGVCGQVLQASTWGPWTQDFSLPIAPSSCGDKKGRVPLGLYPTCSIPSCCPSQRWVMKSCPLLCGSVRVFLA